jgi:calmodulin
MVAAWGARRDWFGQADEATAEQHVEGRGIEHVAARCSAVRADAESAAAVPPTAEARELSGLVDRIHAAIRSAQMRLLTIFKVADSDADGDMSAAELRQHMGKIGCSFTEAEAATVVRALDADGDGGVSVEEFISYMRGYRPGQLLRPSVTAARRIGLARHERIDGYLPAGSAEVYLSVWRAMCDWLDVQVLRGAACRVKGWCRVVYIEAWRYRGGRQRRKGTLPLLVLDDDWAATHGVRLARGVNTVVADMRCGGAPVAELTPVLLGQRCRVPGTDKPMDRHAAAAILALLLHTIGCEAAAGAPLALPLGDLGTLHAREGEARFELGQRHSRPPPRPSTCSGSPRAPRTGRDKLTGLLSLAPRPPNTAPSRLEASAAAARARQRMTGTQDETNLWIRPTTAQSDNGGGRVGNGDGRGGGSGSGRSKSDRLVPHTPHPPERSSLEEHPSQRHGHVRTPRNASYSFWRHGSGAYDLNMLRSSQGSARPRPLASSLAGAIRGRKRALAVGLSNVSRTDAAALVRARPSFYSRSLSLCVFYSWNLSPRRRRSGGRAQALHGVDGLPILVTAQGQAAHGHRLREEGSQAWVWEEEEEVEAAATAVVAQQAAEEEAAR